MLHENETDAKIISDVEKNLVVEMTADRSKKTSELKTRIQTILEKNRRFMIDGSEGGDYSQLIWIKADDWTMAKGYYSIFLDKRVKFKSEDDFAVMGKISKYNNKQPEGTYFLRMNISGESDPIIYNVSSRGIMKISGLYRTISPVKYCPDKETYDLMVVGMDKEEIIKARDSFNNFVNELNGHLGRIESGELEPVNPRSTS